MAGVGEGLLRLSVGLEHEEGLLNDLARALDHVSPSPAALCRYEELAQRENNARASMARCPGA